MLQRVDKWLGMSGMSRSEARRCVAAGRVTRGGEVVRDAGLRVEAEELRLDGAPVRAEEQLYVMVNKPAGVVTATEDGRLPTVMDLLPKAMQRKGMGPVGRLDRDVTGLVLMTTDGELAHRLISPKRKAEKAYIAACEGALDEGDVRAFAQGLALSDFTAKPARLEILASGREGSTARVTLTEGKFHQVKRMFAAVGHPLRSLSRERIGCVRLDPALEAGQYRALTADEIAGLKAQVGL